MDDPHLAQARVLLQEALLLVGEDQVAEILRDYSSASLKNALVLLYGSEWWLHTLKHALTTPTQYNTQLLCKLLDKAVASPQSVRIGAEEGFKLVIEHVAKEAA